jgi:hypothetical protein
VISFKTAFRDEAEGVVDDGIAGWPLVGVSDGL